MNASETVAITGHLIDTGILSRVLDDIREYDGDWVIDRFDVGHEAADLSSATITISSDDDEALQRLLMRLQTRGVNQVDPGEAETSLCEMDGVFPDFFYSTTNLATRVRLAGHWVAVENPEMDCGLIVDESGEQMRIYTLPMADVKAGMNVVCGASGIRVDVPALTKAEGSFGFMESDVSSEKPQAVLVRQVADGMREAKANGEKVLWVGGPGVVHTGAAPAMVALVNAGYVDILFAGNALATHDIESALFGTSLGVDLAQGRGVEHGHEHHIRALNTIRKAGSIAAAVDTGVLTRRDHARPGDRRQGVRARRLGAGRRAPAGRPHRRPRRPARDAGQAPRRRLLPDGRDHAALGRDGQHPPGVGPAGVRRHQPGNGHQARRPRLVTGPRASSPT